MGLLIELLLGIITIYIIGLFIIGIPTILTIIDKIVILLINGIIFFLLL